METTPLTQESTQIQLPTQETTVPTQEPGLPTAPIKVPSYISYTDYATANISCTPPEQKTVPGTGPNATPPCPPAFYNIVPLMYNFGKNGQRIVQDFKIEGCEMSSDFGIQSKPAQGGRIEHSIMTRFDLNNPEHVRFLEVIDQIHAGACYIVSQFKGPLKMFSFNHQAPGETFKCPIYRPRDQMTGELIPGRAPSMFWKLFSRGKPPLVERTLFTDLEEKPIEWELLTNVQMKFVPVIHVKQLYVGGGKCSLQMVLESAFVTYSVARGSTTSQGASIQRYKEAHPELADQVAGQLTKLTMDRQTQLLRHSPTAPDPATETTDGQPTFAGIMRPEQRPFAPPPTATPSMLGALPGIPPMSDFTSTAPMRAPDAGAIPPIQLN